MAGNHNTWGDGMLPLVSYVKVYKPGSSVGQEFIKKEATRRVK